MKTELNLETWNRKEHFLFFKDFEEPFYGVCVNVDCTKAFQLSKEKSRSFFLHYLHKSLAAANRIEPFRYRIEAGKVFVCDMIHASATILRPDHTFGFADLVWDEDFTRFEAGAKREIEQVRNETGLKPTRFGNAVIQYSAVPWLPFTALSHARKYSLKDSCPKISFGKVIPDSGRMLMPVSIHVHHALMDGYTLSEYFERFQELLKEE